MNDSRPIRLLVGILGLESQQAQRRRRAHGLRNARRQTITHFDEPRILLDRQQLVVVRSLGILLRNTDR